MSTTTTAQPEFRNPRLSVAACRLFYRFVAYAREYFTPAKRQTLWQVASDVMDGWHLRTDPEVKELERKGIIEYVRAHGTWVLSDYGCEAVARVPFRPDYEI